MNAVTTFFSSPWTTALGWALIHSLWQALLVCAVILLLLRWIPSRQSHTRYAVALAGMVAQVLFSAITFFYIGERAGAAPLVSGGPLYFFNAGFTVTEVAPSGGDVLVSMLTYVQSHLHVVVFGWICGALIFSLRLAGGALYVARLRNEAMPVAGEWTLRVADLARQLGIQRVVAVGESLRLQAPVVLGYIRPVILLPAGMLSGLSTEQVETILLHELAHIRRHDYLVNMLQLVAEAIFFFNPFVWMISRRIRTEREHCCDDTVVSTLGNPFAYATALAQLEEARLTHTGMALSLAENKNELLNRIKRLMEKSTKHYAAKDRIVPAALLVIGLMCASWLTISRSGGDDINPIVDTKTNVLSDTTIRKTKSKKDGIPKGTTAGDVSQPVEETDTYTIEIDEPLAAMAPLEFPVAVFPPMPPMPDVYAFFHADSVPPHGFNEEQWEEFSAEFENRFKAQFEDFYNDHEKDFEAMMQGIEKDFEKKFDDQWSEEMQAALHARHQAMAEHHAHMDAQREAMEQHAESMKHFEVDMKRFHDEQAQTMKSLEADMKARTANLEAFEKALAADLVKDGYLGANEKIDHLRWSDEGIQVNGKKIREEHRQKYDAIHDRFFSHDIEVAPVKAASPEKAKVKEKPAKAKEKAPKSKEKTN